MTPEQTHQRKPYEIFDITEEEVSFWRVSSEKLKEILIDPQTTTHSIKLTTNTYGEFLFLTASKGKGEQRTCMVFYGLGYHKYRERWINEEWFWNQIPVALVDIREKLPDEEVAKQLEQRLTAISPSFEEDKQTDLGRMFDCLADTTDDETALDEFQALGLLKIASDHNPDF